MSRSGILLALCLFALFGATHAAVCLAYPDGVKLGGNCGFSTYCAGDSFCNKAGICVAKIAAGQPCEYEYQCLSDHQCKGPADQQICVANANPGDACDDSSIVTTPTCYLDCANNICVGGQVGDGCTATSHCSGNLTCVANVCTPVEDGKICISSNDCKPQSYCEDFTNKCRPKKTEGLCFESECAHGYICVGYAGNDSPSCVEYKSREAGEYCTTDLLCKGSMRCFNEKCAAKKVSACTNGNECSLGQFCSCGGDYLLEGTGTCTSDGCYSKQMKYDECISTNCKSGTTSFSKACANLNCADELKAAENC